MTQHTADTRPDLLASERLDADPGEGAVDQLDEIEAELDGLDELDPAASVAVLSDITAALNREIDVDMDKP
jgi:hypothetical protein